jgi:hypothetical protein
VVFLASLVAMTVGGRWLAFRIPELRRMRDLNREADREKLARPRYRAAVQASNRAGLATNAAFYLAVLPVCVSLTPRRSFRSERSRASPRSTPRTTST